MADDSPNIFVLMCDQLNARVLSCYGGPVPTPNISRLAREGVLFTDAICPTPFCSPSRASLITGLYPHTHGIVYNTMRVDYPAVAAPETEEGIRPADATTGKLLNAAGYQTHHYGKWHLSGREPLPYYQDMFLEHHAYAEHMAGTFASVRRRPRGEWMDWYGWALPTEVPATVRQAMAGAEPAIRQHKYAEFIGKMGRLTLPLEQNFDVMTAGRTVERLENLLDGPFMITCSFNYPHDPNVVPAPYCDVFRAEDIELPENYEAREARFEEDWARGVTSALGEGFVREFLRIYYGAVAFVDDQVGRVFAALEATGRAENTIIVFTADHGDMAGGHGMVWKSTPAFYDDVARVPLIIRWPAGIEPGRSDAAANLTDLMPTLLDLVGHPVPDHVQGHSHAGCLRGDRDWREAPRYAFCERVQPNAGHTRDVAPGTPANFMVRGEGWKFVRYLTDDEYLYDLTTDPGETHNLAADPEHASRKDVLRAELERWLQRTNFPLEP